MKRPKVVIIAQNQPIDNDAHLRRKMMDAEVRADRQAVRFSGLDLGAMQRAVHGHIRHSLLCVDGRHADLLDLLNYVKHGRRFPHITPQNVGRHYSLANGVTLNGIFLYQYLLSHGFEPLLVQNFATCDLHDVLAEDPMAVCISSNFIFMNDLRDMASQIKDLAPRIRVIAGGMLVKKVLDKGDGLTRNTLDHLKSYFGKVDAFVIEARGEQTLVRLLTALVQGEDLSRVPNLAFFDPVGEVCFTPREEEHTSMDETAIAWDHIPSNYLRPTLPVNSSRGCAFRCRFCTYHWLFPRVQYKSLETLEQELSTLDALGTVRHIRFTDDNFTASQQRLEAVLGRMIERGFGFTWSSFARASALTPKLVRLMKRSGCEFVDLGLESGSQIILDAMDKKLQKAQSQEAIRILNGEGIACRGSLIVGYPGETEETFEETLRFVNESGLPYHHAYLFYYSGNTRVHEDRAAYGLEGLGLAWRHHTMDAVKASMLLGQMVERVSDSLTDGMTYVEEIYKLLRGEGYSAEEIRRLFRWKRDLQLTMRRTGEVGSQGEKILEKMGAMVR